MSADYCLFCKMIAGDIPVTPVFQNEKVFAFHDIQPQAPTHVLVIPKTHVASLADTSDAQIYADVLEGIRIVAAQLGLSDFRTVFNTGAKAGQSVFHLHGHLLAGRTFEWPPG